MVATGIELGHEAGVPRQPRTSHLHCSSDVDPWPAGAGSGGGARNDSSRSAGECFVLSQGAVRPAGATWDREQALLHQHVGDDLALRSSPAEEGSILGRWREMYTWCTLISFGNTKCALQVHLKRNGVHKVCTVFDEHTSCTHLWYGHKLYAHSVLMVSQSVHRVCISLTMYTMQTLF